MNHPLLPLLGLNKKSCTCFNDLEYGGVDCQCGAYHYNQAISELECWEFSEGEMAMRIKATGGVLIPMLLARCIARDIIKNMPSILLRKGKGCIT